MGKNLVQKIFSEHLVVGILEKDAPIQLQVDQVLTQDATGTMVYLQFEAIGVPKIKVPLAVAYVDHNMLQTTYRNFDDHLYLQTSASKYGAYFSKPGNGICHQVHLERFGVPGGIMLGSDSHTPTCGGLGMIAIGVGGLNIAIAMAGFPFQTRMPEVVRITLKGELTKPWVIAMDVILGVLRIMTVKGGVNKIIEYGGEGVKSLSVTERATITNMGAELGATTSLFPSDELTKKYLKAQKREDVWKPLQADENARYDDEIEINLSALEPLIAQPDSPDKVIKIRDLAGKKVDQVCIGSCTNSSYHVMSHVSRILDGRTIHPEVSMTVTPGSKQVFEMMAKNSDLHKIIKAGARILESACEPCIGMGQTPSYNGVSVRSFNRNFKGRSGNPDSFVYLCNPLAATVIALKGKMVDPRDAGITIKPVKELEEFDINDNLIIPPSKEPEKVKVRKGPNIKEIPMKDPLEDKFEAEVLIALGDNISTDDILPAGSEILPFRSNIPVISKYVFYYIDNTFPERAKRAGKGIIFGGNNYGQGSSRGHAPIAPMYLGVRAVIAKSFTRIHRSNLINFGILPLVLKNPDDYIKIAEADSYVFENMRETVEKDEEITIEHAETGVKIPLEALYSAVERETLLTGELLMYFQQRSGKK